MFSVYNTATSTNSIIKGQPLYIITTNSIIKGQPLYIITIFITAFVYLKAENVWLNYM